MISYQTSIAKSQARLFLKQEEKWLSDLIQLCRTQYPASLPNPTISDLLEFPWPPFSNPPPSEYHFPHLFSLSLLFLYDDHSFSVKFFFPCNLYLGIRQSINGVGDAFGLEMGFNLFSPLSQSMPMGLPLGI